MFETVNELLETSGSKNGEIENEIISAVIN